MKPSAGFNKTVLFGNCMIKKNRRDPNIKEPVYIKGCPVAMEEIIGQLEKIGLQPDVSFFERFRESLANRYHGKMDFDPSHYFMPGATGKNAWGSHGRAAMISFLSQDKAHLPGAVPLNDRSSGPGSATIAQFWLKDGDVVIEVEGTGIPRDPVLEWA